MAYKIKPKKSVRLTKVESIYYTKSLGHSGAWKEARKRYPNNKDAQIAFLDGALIFHKREKS